HELWNEPVATRTAHATTILIRSGDKNILVDPGLPGQAIVARLKERSGLEPADITDVFLTNFRPAHRMGLLAFDKARWLISEMEREFVGRALVDQVRHAEEDRQIIKLLEQEIALLQRC